MESTLEGRRGRREAMVDVGSVRVVTGDGGSGCSPGARTAAPLRLAGQYRPMTPDSRPTLVTLDDIRAAAAGLAGIVVRTPLLPFGPPLVFPVAGLRSLAPLSLRVGVALL